MTRMSPATKSHNSCKTCNIATSNILGHLHVMLVTVCGYEQNPSRGVVEVAYKWFPPYVFNILEK